MSPYEFSLALGFIGLGLMAASGLSSKGAGRSDDVSNVSLHGHGAQGGHALGPDGGHASAGSLTHGNGHGADTAARGPDAIVAASGARDGGLAARAGHRGLARGKGGTRSWLAWLSPRVVFSVLVGVGAAGMLLERHVTEPLRAGLAVVVGVLFEALVVGPIWRLVMSFGSAPAQTLEHAVMSEARAATTFDASGHGLVAIELDGQIVQVLGALPPAEAAANVRVRAGDRLRIEDVDAARNRCTVSRLGPLTARPREVHVMVEWVVIAAVLAVVLVFVPLIVASLLKNVEAGTIRMVSWLQGTTVIYRGPGKSKEIPLLTAGTTLSSKAINVDLDITDQTADVDEQGRPRPIKVRVLASAIVSVGDTDMMIKTAANRFFSKTTGDQENILIDLLSSSGRRAINLLTHDQLFSAKVTPADTRAGAAKPDALAHADGLAMVDDDDDPLAVIIRKACSRELTDLGLIFNSLNIKVVQSEVAEARRRQSAAEAQASADIVAAQQARRAREAQLDAERAISDKQRELEQTRAGNAALIALAEAKKQEAMGNQRSAELEATQIAQARADAERVRIQALASAQAEAIRITTVAEATAESIRKVNQAIAEGGDAYLRYRQIEMLPQLVPSLSGALAQARLVTIAGGDGSNAPNATMAQLTGVIQTVLAAQLVSHAGIEAEPRAAGTAAQVAPTASPALASGAAPTPQLPSKPRA